MKILVPWAPSLHNRGPLGRESLKHGALEAESSPLRVFKSVPWSLGGQNPPSPPSLSKARRGLGGVKTLSPDSVWSCSGVLRASSEQATHPATTGPSTSFRSWRLREQSTRRPPPYNWVFQIQTNPLSCRKFRAVRTGPIFGRRAQAHR